jgi:hypothetical protein
VEQGSRSNQHDKIAAAVQESAHFLIGFYHKVIDCGDRGVQQVTDFLVTFALKAAEGIDPLLLFG